MSQSAIFPTAAELRTPAVLFAVSVFALNNLVFKATFPGVISGKLSDATACFFMPLWVSAVTGALGLRWRPSRRTALGAVITGAILIAVKTNDAASTIMCGLLSAVTYPLGLGPTRNTVDPTDLYCLPACAAAVWFALRLDSSFAWRNSK